MKKIILPIFITLILLIIFMAQNSIAETYFVSQNSAGNGSGSSYNNRMSLSKHNSDIFNPGDTIFLCDRIYSKVIISSSGDQRRPIHYRGDYTGHSGVLDFNGNPMIQFDGADYLIIESLELKNGVIGIATAGSSDFVTIKKCKIYNMNTKGILISNSQYYRGPGVATRNTNITIGGAEGDGNNIHDCGRDTGGTDVSFGLTDGFVVSHNKLYAMGTDYGIDGVATHKSSNGLIEYNQIYSHNYNIKYGEDGIDLKENSNNIVIRYNSIYNHNSQSGITVQMGSNNVDIYGNLIHGNNWAGVLLKKGNYASAKRMNNITIRGNIIYDNGAGVMVQQSGTAPIEIDEVSILNNVLAKNGGKPGIPQAAGVMIQLGSDHEIKNNIFYKNTGVYGKNNYVFQQVSLHKSESVKLDYNHYFYPGELRAPYFTVGSSNLTLNQFRIDKGQEIYGKEGDPLFTDTEKNDYTLLNDSPCINTGKWLGSEYAGLLHPDNVDYKNSIFSIEMENPINFGHWEKGAFIHTNQRSELSNYSNIFPVRNVTVSPFN